MQEEMWQSEEKCRLVKAAAKKKQGNWKLALLEKSNAKKANIE